MIYLIIVSLIWGFSFGLIKGNLTGLDPNFVSFCRLLISSIFFLPFLRFKGLDKPLIFKLVSIGGVQFGLMYLSYLYAYQYLQAYQIALFTIFTPIYISLINDLFNKKFNSKNLIIAIVSIIAAGIIVYSKFEIKNLIAGFLLIQFSNICFAFGQVYYKKLLSEHEEVKDLDVFALLYLGAVAITLFPAIFTTDISSLVISEKQIYTLLYLGIIASGLGFFLWNVGARKTKTGTLSVFNNFKIPIAISVSIIFFGETTDVLRLIIGGFLLVFTIVYRESIKLEL